MDTSPTVAQPKTLVVALQVSAHSSYHITLILKVSVSLLGQDEVEHIAWCKKSLQTTDILLYYSLIGVALAGKQS